MYDLFCNPDSKTFASVRGTEKSQNTNVRQWKLLTIALADMLQMLQQDIVRSPVSKSYSERNIAADILLSSSPILCNIQHIPICLASKVMMDVEWRFAYF